MPYYTHFAINCPQTKSINSDYIVVFGLKFILLISSKDFKHMWRISVSDDITTNWPAVLFFCWSDEQWYEYLLFLPGMKYSLSHLSFGVPSGLFYFPKRCYSWNTILTSIFRTLLVKIYMIFATDIFCSAFPLWISWFHVSCINFIGWQDKGVFVAEILLH